MVNFFCIVRDSEQVKAAGLHKKHYSLSHSNKSSNFSHENESEAAKNHRRISVESAPDQKTIHNKEPKEDAEVDDEGDQDAFFYYARYQTGGNISRSSRGR